MCDAERHGSLFHDTSGPGGPMPPVAAWRIHLGAHKTATTHLQETLHAVRPALVGRGVDPIPVAQFRPIWKRYARRRLLVSRSGITRLVYRVSEGRTTTAFLSALEGLRLGPSEVILSEENILGETAEAVGAFYADIGRRLRLLHPLQAIAPMHVFLCIRRTDEFMASVYAEALKHHAIHGPFEEANSTLLDDPPRWTDIVAEIRAALPQACLTVWRYEDYRANAAAITGALCGVDPGPLPRIARPRRTMSPAAEAVRAAEALPDGPGRKAEVARLYAAAPASAAHPVFRPFDPRRTARFRDAYRDDCAALNRQGCLVNFPSSP